MTKIGDFREYTHFNLDDSLLKVWFSSYKLRVTIEF